MAVRFYFDLIDDVELIRDDEGVEAADFAQVREQAEAVIAEMREDGALPSHRRRWHLLIRDENGVIRESLGLS